MDESTRVKARAEARRKRILQSAENRLDRLRNIESKSSGDSSNTAVPDTKGLGNEPLVAEDILTGNLELRGGSSGVSASTSQHSTPTLAHHDIDPDRKTVDSIDAEKQCKLLHKYCSMSSVALGIVLRLMFATSLIPDMLQNVVVPYVFAETALLYTFRKGLEYTSSTGHLLSTALIMSGLSGQQLHLLKVCFTASHYLLDHFTLYAAAFITTHIMLYLVTW